MDMKHCRGCYNDFYNTGTKQCWSFKDATLIFRKEVHVDQVPPWKQKAKLLPSCYRKQRYVYVRPNQEY